MTKITELTQHQKDMTAVYRDRGIKIGFSTHDEESFDLQAIWDLTQKHRVMCGVPEAKTLWVADSPHAAYKAIKKTGATLGAALYGNLDINWLNHHDFFRTECGLVEETKMTQYLLELTKYVGFMWMNSDSTVISKKPVRFTTYLGDMDFTDVNGKASTFKAPVLHNDSGPSIEYADGTTIYHLWGVRIPRELSWIVTDDILDIKKVMRIKNEDIKSLALKKLGPEKAFDKVNKELLHTKTLKVGGTYELYAVDFGGEDKERYLKMTCPSKGSVHIEGVAPECMTVDQALGYRSYKPGWDEPGFRFTEPRVQS